MDTIGRESFWKKLLAGEGSFRNLRTVLILIFLGGTVFFGWGFKKVVDLSAEAEVRAKPPASQSQEDSKRLDSIIDSFRTSVEARHGSKATSASLVDGNRQPLVATRPSAKGAASAGIVDVPLIEPLVVEALPPIMFVRAIMVVGKESIAIMDINGVGNGIIVKAGYSFLEKQGRIVKITPEKVTVRWAGKNIDIAPGF